MCIEASHCSKCVSVQSQADWASNLVQCNLLFLLKTPGVDCSQQVVLDTEGSGRVSYKQFVMAFKEAKGAGHWLSEGVGLQAPLAALAVRLQERGRDFRKVPLLLSDTSCNQRSSPVLWGKPGLSFYSGLSRAAWPAHGQQLRVRVPLSEGLHLLPEGGVLTSNNPNLMQCAEGGCRSAAGV